MKPILFTLALLSALITASSASAQVSRLEPAQPHQGESITITYDPAFPGAELKLGDEVYAVGTFLFDIRQPSVRLRLNKVNGVLQGHLEIEPNAAYLRLSFVTRHAHDSKADLATMIYRRDGAPARGAYHAAMYDRYADAVTLAQQDLALYPDDYTVYRDKWMFAGMVMKRDDKLAMVQKDMAVISAKPQTQSPDWLYAMSHGDLELGNERQASELLAELIERYPSWYSTGELLDRFESIVKSPDYKAQARGWRRELVKHFPGSAYARFVIDSLAAQGDFPFADTQAVVRKWTEDDPEDPDPYVVVGTAYSTHRQDYGDAHTALERAIQLLLAGEYRIRGDWPGSLTRRRLYEAYSTQAEIFLDERNYSQALATGKAAESFETDIQGRGQVLEGKVWQAVSDDNRAESAYLEAWRRDPDVGEAPLKLFYQTTHGNLKSFQQYLDARRLVQPTNEGEKAKPAPAFQAVSLDGERLSLADLRGKVVVLNFWFVGCGACMSEIPILNHWVQEFKDQGVVFIGFALDHEDQLRAYLKKVPFSYKIVPDSSDIAAEYAVPAYPTHVLIDRNGDIRLKLVGDENPGNLENQLKQMVRSGSLPQ
jgi:peroxiredoxin